MVSSSLVAIKHMCTAMCGVCISCINDDIVLRINGKQLITMGYEGQTHSYSTTEDVMYLKDVLLLGSNSQYILLNLD